MVEQRPKWKLTDKRYCYCPACTALAQAQAKKLVEYYDGTCVMKGHRGIGGIRKYCPDCQRELRRQVGLE